MLKKILNNLHWRPLWTILVLFLTGLDITTKFFALKYLSVPLIVWPNVFQLQLSLNPGIAFSIPLPNILMAILSPILIAAIILLIVHSFKTEVFVTKLGIALLVSGGLGNLINRFWTSAVIDFIDFSFWPSFNLADSYLTISAFLFIIFYGKITITKYGRSK